MVLYIFHSGLTFPAFLISSLLIAISLFYGFYSFGDSAFSLQSDRRAFFSRDRLQLQHDPGRIRPVHCRISADRISSPARSTLQRPERSEERRVGHWWYHR